MTGNRPVRLGMVGGGNGAFIGPVHRMAAMLDGEFSLVAGALASDPARAKQSGLALGLAQDRCYGDYTTMASAEAARADGIEAVAIVTPNHTHLPIASTFLRAGIDVICEKPVTASLAEARELASVVAKSGCVLVVTHNYTGYPLVREARARVAAGELGALRLVQVEYAQGWLAERLELAGSKQAAWRTDPSQAGAGGALGDIGTHAFNLACFVTGQAPQALLADLSAFGAGRRLDDNAGVLLRYASGARGALWASQVAVGCLNGLRLRLYGESGGLEWSQENPNSLIIDRLGEPRRLFSAGGAGIGTDAASVTRLPAGHPEGFIEAFATIYREAAQLIRARREGRESPSVLAPCMQDGVASMEFVEACVRSSRQDSRWVELGL